MQASLDMPQKSSYVGISDLDQESDPTQPQISLEPSLMPYNQESDPTQPQISLEPSLMPDAYIDPFV